MTDDDKFVPLADVETTRTYECFSCGERVESATAVDCPECGGSMRNIERPLEGRDEREPKHTSRSFTERHYRMAVEQLEDMDSVIDVRSYDFWQSGEIFVHTNYVDTGVVEDIRSRFDLKIFGAGVEYPRKHTFDCVSEHGTCFEIALDFYGSSWDLPDEERFYDNLEEQHENTEYGKWLDEKTKMFKASLDE